MLTIFPVLSLMGYALLISGRLRVQFACAVLPGFALAITLVMLAAVAGFLRAGDIAITALGLLSLADPSGRRALIADRQGHALVFFLGACIVLYFYLNPLKFIFWDEFSHWGRFSKFLLETDRLPATTGEVLFAPYPPGPGLAAYFIGKPTGFHEGLIIYAVALLQIGALLPFLASMNLKDVPVRLFVAAALLIVGALFGPASYNWTTVLPDNMLAFVAAASITVYFAGGRRPNDAIVSGLILALICGIKDSGNLLAATIGLAIAVDQIAQCKSSGKPVPFILIALVALPSACVIAAWKLHVVTSSALPVFDGSISAVKQRINSPGFGSFATETAHSYLTAFSGLQIGKPPLSLTLWLISIALLAVTSIFAGTFRATRSAILTMHGALLLGFVAYATMLLYFYLVLFNPFLLFAQFQGKLPGTERYLGTYIMMWVVSGLGMLTFSGLGVRTRIGAIAWSCVIVLFGGSTFLSGAATGPRGDASAAEALKVRALVSDSLFPYRNSVPLDARVYVLWNGVSGFPYYISLYELTPRTTSFPQFFKLKDRFSDPFLWCTSLGPPRFDGDIWSCNWSIEKFTEEVKSYDYLFVDGVDQVFITHYGSMFAPGSLESGAKMFRLTQKENGICFEPVPRHV